MKNKNQTLTIVVAILAVLLVLTVILGVRNRAQLQQMEIDDGVRQIDLDTIYLEGSAVEVDFSEVLLSEHSESRKLIVDKQIASVSITLTDRLIEMIDAKFMKKTQTVSYTGTGYFVVDLDKLSKESIVDDKENKTLTIRIDHAYLEDISIRPEDVIIDEVQESLLARGDIELTVADFNTIEKKLLAEIDGFDSSKGVVILAATNRPEILDKALLRPGRFDRRIVVDNPNFQGRLDTLKVHTRKIKLGEDVDLKKIAYATAGCVGADLANLVNEAALRAVRMGRKFVNQEDLMASIDTVVAGAEKKNTVLTETEKRLVAYHEVGHALVSTLEKKSIPVSKITIVPHTEGALGYTMYLPEEEKYLSTKDELLSQLRGVLGGRAAEQVVFNVQTNGASNDIQKATALARHMVSLYGMSDELGLMATASIQSQYLDGQAHMDCSQETAFKVDMAVQKILNQCYEDAKRILTENRALLDEIEGLALYIGMAEKDRLDAMNPPEQSLEHYQELLPYAVALRDLFTTQTRKEITPQHIMQTVADYYSITVNDLICHSRRREITVPRQIAMYLTREMTNLSLPQIGQVFGNRDHTTVLHGCDKVAAGMKDTASGVE